MAYNQMLHLKIPFPRKHLFWSHLSLIVPYLRNPPPLYLWIRIGKHVLAIYNVTHNHRRVYMCECMCVRACACLWGCLMEQPKNKQKKNSPNSTVLPWLLHPRPRSSCGLGHCGGSGRQKDGAGLGHHMRSSAKQSEIKTGRQKRMRCNLHSGQANANQFVGRHKVGSICIQWLKEAMSASCNVLYFIIFAKC